MANESSSAALLAALRIAGTQTALAEAIGASQQLLSYLVRHNRPISAKYVLATEAATGISRHDLRPDLYPLEHDATVAKTIRPRSCDRQRFLQGMPR